ncbi:MAG: hypothetical protein CVV45_18025 [Spirochaetae bacterium HGW-Spirochaetae-10]|nr:MAG: hypothetical protein CVV45_18025 [Spirochaetae bacterium HGW-Spirochaetae-10]
MGTASQMKKCRLRDMIPTRKSFRFAIARLTLLLAMIGCYNPEYTEEDCEGMLLGLAVNELLPGPPNATEAEKAALTAQGREMFSTFYLYCRAQIPPQDPLDRATGINIF